MSNFETRDNSGSLFTNNKKAENHPDFRGKCKVNGVDMEVAVWNKTSAKGIQFMSMSFSEPWVNPNAEVQAEADGRTIANPSIESPSSEMPF